MKHKFLVKYFDTETMGVRIHLLEYEFSSIEVVTRDLISHGFDLPDNTRVMPAAILRLTKVPNAPA